MCQKPTSPPHTARRHPDRTRRSAQTALALLVLLPRAATAESARTSPRLERLLASAEPTATLVLWVYLADKPSVMSGKPMPAQLVSARSLARRSKVRSPETLVDRDDLPLDPGAVAAVRARVARVRQRSKWLNALSVDATPAQIGAVAALPCVRRLEPVLRYRSRGGPEPEIESTPPGNPGGGEATLALDYGPSLGQLSMLGVPTLHTRGITGQGVLIGHFDNGYRLLSHQALAAVPVVAAHDFVDGDADPAPPAGAPSSFGAHGILTLSALAGYAPGHLIGAAYGASYVLARTENDASETPVEEDNWVAAIEWADSIGIDVASTSLGYRNYDAPYPSWTWEDMDGNTTAITRAADLAVARGIVVVNSAGNSGFNAEHNTLLAPADGDSVIAVGAVDAAGVRTGFSSVGPTAAVPPRFKPDVAAQGSQVACASASDPAAYTTAGGTSLSCPLTAGVAALLLAAYPGATPMQIRAALQQTASQAAAPDNLLGWGIVDAVAALDWLAVTDAAGQPSVPGFRLAANVPNPFNPSTRIIYSLGVESRVTLRIYDAAGRRVCTLVDTAQPPSTQSVVWNGTDDAGRAMAAGVYVCRLDAWGVAGPAVTGVRKLVLLP